MKRSIAHDALVVRDYDEAIACSRSSSTPSSSLITTPPVCPLHDVHVSRTPVP